MLVLKHFNWCFQLCFKHISKCLLHVCFVYSAILTRYLAETGENSSLAGIIAVSTMWDVVESMNELERFPKRQLYSYHLSGIIRERVRMSVIIFVNKSGSTCLI